MKIWGVLDRSSGSQEAIGDRHVLAKAGSSLEE